MAKLRSQIREFFLLIKLNVCTKFYGMNIHSTAQISWGAKLDKSYPQGVHVDSGSLITSGTLVLTHDFCRKLRKETFIGKNCFIGANSVIMPGVKIGDNSIVGAGSVVTKDVPPGCIAAGNPARIIKSGITTSKFGQIRKN